MRMKCLPWYLTATSTFDFKPAPNEMHIGILKTFDWKTKLKIFLISEHTSAEIDILYGEHFLTKCYISNAHTV